MNRYATRLLLCIPRLKEKLTGVQEAHVAKGIPA
jgi:hypothetical protein